MVEISGWAKSEDALPMRIQARASEHLIEAFIGREPVAIKVLMASTWFLEPNRGYGSMFGGETQVESGVALRELAMADG